jgi:hypothetical protein
MRKSVKSHNPLCHLPKRLVVTAQEFQRIAVLFVPPLVQPIGHRPLEAVDLGFQSGVPRDLSKPPQPILPAYFILNTSG